MKVFEQKIPQTNRKCPKNLSIKFIIIPIYSFFLYFLAQTLKKYFYTRKQTKTKLFSEPESNKSELNVAELYPDLKN